MRYSTFVSNFDPDAAPMPAHADAVDDYAEQASRSACGAERYAQEIQDVVSGKRDAIPLDAYGYTSHHRATWRSLASEIAQAEQALYELLQRVRAA